MLEDKQLCQINQLLTEALDGNLSCRLEEASLDGRYTELYRNICRLLDMHRQLVFDMQTVTAKILSVSEDLTATLDDSTRLSAELMAKSKAIGSLNSENARSTGDAIADITGLISHIVEIRQAADSAKTSNTAAESAIRGGLSQVLGLIERIGQVETATGRTVEYVEKFKTSAASISKILRNVNDIARETEILSFNASIESKRAGVHGLGFGVIAGSIRDLANTSRSEVSHIEDAVREITEGLHQLTENIHHNYQDVHASVESTRTIESSLDDIDKNYTRLSGQIGRIADMAGAAGGLADRVTGKVSQIGDNSRKVTGAFEDIYGSIRAQNELAGNLQHLGGFLSSESASLSKLTGDTESVRIDSKMVEQKAAVILETFRQGILTDSRFMEMTPAAHRLILDRFIRQNGIEAIWTNDDRGRFIYSTPPAGIANARAREWFRESAAGRSYVSPVYISAITRKPCVTVSMPVHGADGRIAGVIGADLKII